MGNTNSIHTVNHPHDPVHKHRVIHRKRSTAFSALTLGCVSAHSDPASDCSSQTTAISDGDQGSTLKEKSSFETCLPPLYANSSIDLQEDETSVAYKDFLKEYPQYQLTWIVDSLRRSDFRRLDRNSETYVDYMGGSLYPESLIQVHTEFLNRSVLGNTHSVSNS